MTISHSILGVLLLSLFFVTLMILIKNRLIIANCIGEKFRIGKTVVKLFSKKKTNRLFKICRSYKSLIC